MPLSENVSGKYLLAVRLELGIQRNVKGMTYDDLALASGVSRRALVAIESGKSRGSLESWLQICDALGTTFAAFLNKAFASHLLHVVPHDLPPQSFESFTDIKSMKNLQGES